MLLILKKASHRFPLKACMGNEKQSKYLIEPKLGIKWRGEDALRVAMSIRAESFQSITSMNLFWRNKFVLVMNTPRFPQQSSFFQNFDSIELSRVNC